MVIRAKTNAVRTSAPVAARSRTRRALKLSEPAILATYVVDITITSEERMRTAAMFVGDARGLTPEQVAEKIAPDGEPDIGATIMFLLEESMTAFASATGATIGTPEVDVEELEPAG